MVSERCLYLWDRLLLSLPCQSNASEAKCVILSSLLSKLAHADADTDDLLQQFLATQAIRDASKLLRDSKGDDDVQ